MTCQKEIDELKILIEKLNYQSKVITENVNHNYLFINDLKDTMTRANHLLIQIRKALYDEKQSKKNSHTINDREDKK